MYIADCYNDRIRKVTVSSTTSTPRYQYFLNITDSLLIYTTSTTPTLTPTTTSTPSSSYPSLSPSIGIITTIAGSSTSGSYSGDGSAATSANLYNPYGVTVDATGKRLYN